jgi:hypothetical protein
MSKRNFKMWALSVLLGGLLCLGALPDSLAGVNINIGTPGVNVRIGPPPPVVIESPPPMAVIPGTYVYVAPNVGVDILFYHGHWYRPHRGQWFTAPTYNGPWTYVPSPRMPRAILQLPPGYRRLPPGHPQIPYEHVSGNWERWERERHWHKDKDWRAGWREGHGEVGRGHEMNRGRGHEKNWGHGRRD